MKKYLTAGSIALALLPMSAAFVLAAPAHMAPAKKTAPLYQCQKCHMKVSAAVAKKDHYKDPMDGGKFVPVKSSNGHGKPMGGMKM